MRIARLLPLALAAAAVGGCGTGSEGTEQAALRVPRRDLTLQQAGAPEVEVASPVELARAPVERRATHRPQRARRAVEVAPPEATHDAPAPVAPAPAPVQFHADPISLATSAESEVPEAPDPHALAPGQTVTLIPASSRPASDGPSGAPDWTDERPDHAGRGPTIHVGGRGGSCGGRGPGRRPGGGGFRGLR